MNVVNIILIVSCNKEYNKGLVKGNCFLLQRKYKRKRVL